MVDKQMTSDYLACALEAAGELRRDRYVAISADPRIGAALAELNTLLLGGIDNLNLGDLASHRTTLTMLARHHTVEPEARRIDSGTLADLQALSDLVDRLWACLSDDQERKSK